MDLTQFIGVGAIGLTLGETVVTDFIESIRNSKKKISAAWKTTLKESTSKFTESFQEQEQKRAHEKQMKALYGKKSKNRDKSKDNDIINKFTVFKEKNVELENLKQVKWKKEDEKKEALNNREDKTAKLLGEEIDKLNDDIKKLEENIPEIVNEIRDKSKDSSGNPTITYENLYNAENKDNVPTKRFTLSENAKENIKAIGGTAISTALTTALITAISGADFETVIKTTGISALTASIPTVLNAVIPFLLSKLTPVISAIVPLLTNPIGAAIAGLAAVAAAGAIAIAIYKKNQEEAHQAEITRLSKVKETNEELNKQTQQQIDNAKKARKEQENLMKNVETVNKLQNKGFLTTQEKTDLEDAQNYLTENYEELAEWDETHTHLTIIEDKLAEIEENTKKEDNTAGIIYSNTKAIEKNYQDKIEKTDELTTELINSAQDTDNSLTSSSVDDFLKTLKDLEKLYGSDFVSILQELYGTDNIDDIFALNPNLNFTTVAKDITDKLMSQVNEEARKGRIENKRDRVEYDLENDGWDKEIVSIAKYSSDRHGNEAVPPEIIFNGDIVEDDWAHDRAGNEDLEKILAKFGYGAGLDKNISDITDADGNLAKYEDLTDQLKQYLDINGVDKEKWDKIRKNKNFYADTLAPIFASALLDHALDPNDQKYFEQHEEAYKKFADLFKGDNANKTYSELNDAVEAFEKSYSGDTDFIADLEAYMENDQSSVMYQMNEAIKTLGKDGFGIDESILNNLTQASLNTLSTELSNLNLSGTLQTQLANSINSMFKDIKDPDVINALANIPLENLGDLTVESSQEYIDLLTEATGDAAEAEKIFNEYINAVKSATAQAFYGTSGVAALQDSYNQAFSDLSEKYGVLLEAQQEYQEKGRLSSETYYKLLEAGFDEYVDITSEGYTLLADKANEGYVSAAMQPLNDIQNKIKENENALEQVKNRRGDKYSLKGYIGNTSFVYEGIDDVIAKYIDNGNEFDTTLCNLSDDQKQYIATIVQAGYTTEEDYVKALKDGKAALEDMQPTAYISGLEALREEYESLSQTIDELNDKLDELNEEQVKNKKAVDEADKALKEARYGTEDFQSGLDGLVNYTSKLEKLDNAIEDIKDNLNDVNDVGEASKLYSNLSSTFDSKAANLSAQNKVIRQAISNLGHELSSKYGQYINFDKNGTAQIDFNYLHMNDNDEIKKAFEEEYNTYEEYQDKLRENNKALKEIEDEREEIRKESLDNYVSIQEKVISILEEKAKEEIDITKNKYDAIKEADDDYLNALEDAINKQKELRDKENSYNDLAQKEKKLSLLQRDTSGANAKDVTSLEKEIQDSREKLLDESIDDIVNNLKELYEKQAEARELEIEYMEETTENAQYFNDWAQSIMANWNSIEDMQSWFLDNNPDVEGMTVEQTEQYMNELSDNWTQYVEYIALTTTNFEENADTINTEMNDLFSTTGENISSIGTVIYETAEKAKADAIASAQESYDSAKKTFDDTQKEITDTEKQLREAESAAVKQHSATMDAMVEASQSGLEEVATYATTVLAEFGGYDLTNPEEAEDFAERYKYKNEKGEYSENFVAAVKAVGGDISQYQSDKWELSRKKKTSNEKPQVIGTYNSESEAKIARDKAKSNNANKDYDYYVNRKKYLKGGLVNYTGPAWVDGTKSRPEAFLSADDTQRIGAAARLLSEIPFLDNNSYNDQSISTNVGDTTIGIYFTVESIGNDYDVDRMMDRVKDVIVDAAHPTGSNVILKK